MRRVISLFFVICLVSSIHAKEAIIPFDTTDSQQESNSLLQLAYSNKQLILLRIDNTFPSQMPVYYYAITEDDTFGTTLNNKHSPKISLSAKEHTLEFASPKEEKLIKIKLNFQANTSYLVYFNDYQLVIKTDKEEVVSYENIESPCISEPATDQPSCLFESKNSGLMSKQTFLIYRIDDQITAKYNDKYTQSPVIAYFGFPYSVRLSPGNHTILCKVGYGTNYGLLSYSITYNFEQGKKYKVDLVDFKKFKKTGIPEFKIIESVE